MKASGLLGYWVRQAEIPKKKLGEFAADRPMEKMRDGSRGSGRGLTTRMGVVEVQEARFGKETASIGEINNSS